MRKFMNIFEARRPRAARVAPVDTSGFASEITTIMRKLAAHPYDMRFSHAWTDKARKSVSDQLARLQASGNADDFDAGEYLTMIVDRMWDREGRDDLISVRRNVAHAEEQYQHYAAERADQQNNLDFWIESSDYLTAMAAQVKCATELQTIHSLTDPQSAKAILMSCNRFMTEWSNYYQPRDGSDEPMLDEDFVEVIQCLFPLMLLVFTKG